MKLVVFDIAGTTVKDGGRVRGVFLSTLKALGATPDSRIVDKMMGMGKKEVFEKMGIKDPESAFAEFRSRMHESYVNDPAEPMPNAEKVFDILVHQGIKIAFTTGFHRDTAELVFSQLGWDIHLKTGRFSSLTCSDDVSRGRPMPFMMMEAAKVAGGISSSSVAKVGDTVVDVQEGRNFGAGVVIGVLGGTASFVDYWPYRSCMTVVSEIGEVPEILNSKRLNNVISTMGP